MAAMQRRAPPASRCPGEPLGRTDEDMVADALYLVVSRDRSRSRPEEALGPGIDAARPTGSEDSRAV
jgi:hypothetical protein